MCERVQDLIAGLRRAAKALDPARLAPSDAARLVELFSEGERLCAAGRTLAAGRVSDSTDWRASGHRTPALWLAARTRGTLGQAIASLQTAHHLDSLHATREAFVAGTLSEVQAADIAMAAAVDPSAEASLLDAAQKDSVAQLKERCREVRAAAVDDDDWAERIRRGRYLRNWIDRDGAVRLNGRFAPDDGANLLAAVESRAARLQTEAKRSGQREPAEAYAADALLRLATGGGAGPRAVVHVEVDAAALERGRVRAGETCRIPGVGPIPVAVARRLASDGTVKIIQREGVDVARVAHPGRTISAHVRTALEARDPACVVPGCDVRTGLEIDHVVPFAAGGATRLDNLARLCRYHHAQKTHHGWKLSGAPGTWIWRRAGRAPPPSRAP